MNSRVEKSSANEAGIKSIEVGGRLLDVFTDARRPMSLGELALLSKMSASKAHRYLVSFQRMGLVQQYPQTHLYALGDLAVRLGLSAAAQVNPRRELQRLQTALRDCTKQTVLLSVWTDRGPMIMNVEEGLSPVVAVMKVGTALPLLATAAGRLFAAWMPWPVVEPFVHAEIAQTLQSTGPEDLAAAVREFHTSLGVLRERGLENRFDSLLPNISAIAAPFTDARMQLVGVLSVIGHSDMLDISFDGEIAQALQAAIKQFQLSVQG